MASNGGHGLMPPGGHRKRKDRDSSDPPRAPPQPPSQAELKHEPVAGNRLLAGYLAHEFLTKGTLFGNRPGPEPNRKPDRAHQPKTYADVARVFKTDGVHVPGVVNPTQLARWLQM
ncbi:uncharacterized protein LOC120262475 [Dioscorea cayenensis subsp. rotundata]|uniref:Uncharacterized protein LOC120262475 n=1 Tax=Dioscorea cayennensis subsp. rotundata TaxID=55577 RepID=A0AB40BHF7_DIOCR|nr:uncharacterized protein LOC120262475 [Dioscorea cayenensis subsp. rotundata]